MGGWTGDGGEGEGGCGVVSQNLEALDQNRALNDILSSETCVAAGPAKVCNLIPPYTKALTLAGPTATHITGTGRVLHCYQGAAA